MKVTPSSPPTGLVMKMTTIALALALVSDLALSPGLVAAQDKEEKLVTLAWFPSFSPDAKWLVTPHGSWRKEEAGEVRVWNVTTGKPRYVIASPRGVRAVIWSPKGTFFASGNYQGDLWLYDPETVKVILELKTPRGSIEVLQVTPDEQSIVAASGSGSVHVWDLKSKKLKKSIQAHSGGIWGMRLAADGKTLATAGKDAYVRVWNLDTGKPLHELQHPGETNGVAFTSDSKILATGCQDGKTRFFNVSSGKEYQALVGHRGGITDLCFTRDDKRLISSGVDHTVRIWNVEKLEQESIWEGHRGLVFGATYSYDDKLAATGSWDGTVRIWETSSGKLLHSLER
jgi:WD40 repeat protein